MDIFMKLALWLNGLIFLFLIAFTFLYMPGLVLVAMGIPGLISVVILISIPVWGIRVGSRNRHAEDFNTLYMVCWILSWLNLVILVVPFIFVLL